MYCRKCQKEKEPSDGHHLHPKALGGSDKEERIWLCEGCHDFVHKLMLNWIGNYLGYKEAYACGQYIKKRTLGWLPIEEKRKLEEWDKQHQTLDKP